MEFQQVLERRHAVREFVPEPVQREVLDRLVHAAALAPSAGNEQPWHFYLTLGDARQKMGAVIAQSTVHLQEFADVLPAATMEAATHWYASLGDAPVLVAVSMKEAADELDSLNKQLSIGAAIENLLLAAVNEGLAACNITFSFWVRDELNDFLELPAEESVVAVVAIGRASSTPPLAPAHHFDVATYLE